MKLIKSPLQHNSKSIEIKNLHYILYFLKVKLNSNEVNQLFDAKDFIPGYKEEVNSQQFGKATAEMVHVFQKGLNISKRTHNGIDHLTADKFNELLKQYRRLDIEKPALWRKFDAMAL